VRQLLFICHLIIYGQSDVIALLRRRSRQQERLYALVLFNVHLFVRLFVRTSVAKMRRQKHDFLKKTKQFRAMVCGDDLYRPTWALRRTHYSRWRTSAILKVVKLLYLNEKSSDFDEIWCTNADLELGDSHVTKYENF